MISFLRKHRQTLILSVFVIFLIGIFVGLGGYFFTGADNTEAVAVVGGTKLPYLDFRVRVSQFLDSMRAQNKEVSDAMSAEVKQEMLRDMIVNELLAQEADKMGLRVSDTELSLAIQQSPSFQREGRFDQNLYFQIVRSAYKTSPELYERFQRRAMLSSKLKTLILRSAKIVPSELRSEYLRGGGKLVDFEKNQEAFARDLQQKRALDSINFYLRQLSTQVEIRSYLDQRERGA
ncbi:MAG TPA: hypothetical protein DD417_16550 [Elusimicrobia bacterium]|nr:hypothetical protein [Elusimicrobiota bacterium]